ncbi:MAG: DNA polymerase Y family protein [Sulfuritalea sp.]|nr:DNA polymerase Y family protein [Sulfuritalea sp.]
MLWLALHCPTRPASASAAASPPDDGPRSRHTRDSASRRASGIPVAQSEPLASAVVFPTAALACWAGRFTPQVNLAPDALRLEIAGSLRLFGGLPALLQLVREDLAAMELPAQLAVAATPLAALWLARAGGEAICGDLPATRAALAAVPLTALELAPPLARRVEAFGLRRIGDLLALPRASLGIRLGKPFVIDLARALGEIPDPQVCFVFPEHFEQGLELPAPVAAAPVLLFAAHRLIATLAGWLTARNAAVREIEWLIDHGHGASTVVPLAFSAPVHGAARIERVLKERLDTLVLSAPALALRLRAAQAQPREARSLALFDGGGQRHEALAELMDRLVARLGPQAVQGLACHADHRPEFASRASRAGPAKPARESPAPSLPSRPLWLIDPPEALREAQGRPQRGGPLALAAGPERIESGWWDGGDVRRDYFIAIDGAGRWLWIFRDPRPPGGWFLHGWFA